MPTASSNQIRRNAARITTMIAIRYPVLFTFLIINSHRRPVPSSRTPATTKSESFQFTSSVNCIAINGMSNRNITVSTMPISLLFFIMINFLLHPPGIFRCRNYSINTCRGRHRNLRGLCNFVNNISIYSYSSLPQLPPPDRAAGKSSLLSLCSSSLWVKIRSSLFDSFLPGLSGKRIDIYILIPFTCKIHYIIIFGSIFAFQPESSLTS